MTRARVGDEQVRELERRATTGDLAARRELLKWRLRAKQVDRDRLRLAAYLGDPTASELCAARSWKVPAATDDLLHWVAGLSAWEHAVGARAAAAIARVALEPWERGTACKACGWRHATPAQRKACPKHREDLKPRRAVEALEDWIRAPSEERSDAAMRLCGSLGWINCAVASTQSWGAKFLVESGELDAKDLPATLARDACENARRAAEAALKEVDAVALRRALQRDLVPWAVAHRDPLDERAPASPWRVEQAPPTDGGTAWQGLERARGVAARADCLRELVRLGELTKKRVDVARALGDGAARAALAKSRGGPRKARSLAPLLTVLSGAGPGAAAAAVALARRVESLIAPAKARKRAGACLRAAEAALEGDASGLDDALDDAHRLAHELSRARGPVAAAARACAFTIEATASRAKRTATDRALRSVWLNAVDALELSKPARVRRASQQALQAALDALDADAVTETDDALGEAMDAAPARRAAIEEADSVARQAGIAWALSRA